MGSRRIAQDVEGGARRGLVAGEIAVGTKPADALRALAASPATFASLDTSAEAIEDICPLEDRVPDRRVFQGITEASAYQAMSRACRNAEVPHHHPHDLRHRRITIWHQSESPHGSSPNVPVTPGRR